MAKLDPGVVLAERFRVEHSLPFAASQPAFVATDQVTGAKLLAFDVNLDVSAAQRPGVGVVHSHIATVGAIVAHEDTDVLLSEFIPGLSAESFSDGAPRLTPVDTVRFVLRALDGLQALHHVNAAHGLIRPAALILEPEGRPRPVLSYVPTTLSPTVYRSPERGASGPSSIADDAWAMTAVLFRLLTGRDPPAQGFSGEADLKSAGIDNAVLAAALAHGLATDPNKRSQEIQDLRRELARWFADHAGDDAGHSSASLMHPPPLPPRASQPPSAHAGPISLSQTMPSHAPGLTTSVPTAKPKPARGALYGIVAVLALVVGLGAAYIVSAVRAKPRVRVVEKTAPAANQTAPSAVSLGEVAVTGESASDGGGDPLASCVAAHLPKDSLKKSPDFAWLCSETDPRSGGEKLKVAVVQGAAGGAPTDAMRLMSQLGWYQMAAFAAVRETCCPDLKPLELPEPSKGCDSLVKPLDEIAKAVGAAGSLDDPISHFEKAAKCETDAKHASLFRRASAPAATEQAAFRELLKSVQ